MSMIVDDLMCEVLRVLGGKYAFVSLSLSLPVDYDHKVLLYSRIT